MGISTLRNEGPPTDFEEMSERDQIESRLSSLASGDWVGKESDEDADSSAEEPVDQDTDIGAMMGATGELPQDDLSVREKPQQQKPTQSNISPYFSLPPEERGKLAQEFQENQRKKREAAVKATGEGTTEKERLETFVSERKPVLMSQAERDKILNQLRGVPLPENNPDLEPLQRHSSEDAEKIEEVLTKMQLQLPELFDDYKKALVTDSKSNVFRWEQYQKNQGESVEELSTRFFGDLVTANIFVRAREREDNSTSMSRPSPETTIDALRLYGPAGSKTKEVADKLNALMKEVMQTKINEVELIGSVRPMIDPEYDVASKLKKEAPAELEEDSEDKIYTMFE